ncbi:NAD(P)-dependent oxidoreductase [Adhaeretor mobilis]|uniref:2-hydroxy-3-oxopropionate reductase n=1 Tax=Adhaeretor mobilis TaxID=1930276 RepID=A0A517MR34_9BACT|nr:NAD(P)-dependent oxidoreductase [Adhaeretor mobilis]QDS97339.1 2-hydroxy-3-oxopropionate reductase [Adhaeretor mobilis]
MSKQCFSPEEIHLGWIGTGVMGGSMCRHLMETGYSVTLYSRTRSKAEPLLAAGAKWADSPRAVAEASHVVFSIVGHPADVREVILGEKGALAGLASGGVLVEMTTSLPSLAVEIAELALEREVIAIDAPVSGGDVGAKNGTLSIMIGGDRPTVESLQPCWDAMGSNWVWQGPAGAGQHTKIVNQTLVAAGMIGVCEALLYAYKAGLNLDSAFKAVATGAAGSWAFSNLGPRIIAGDDAPGFFIEHLIKDLGIVLAEAEALQLKLPGVELARDLYNRAAEAGHGRSGTQALIHALANISGIDWSNRD